MKARGTCVLFIVTLYISVIFQSPETTELVTVMTIMTIFRIYAVYRSQAYLNNTVIIVTYRREALKILAFSGDDKSPW